MNIREDTKLQFDEESHQYFCHGMQIPSVTKIIKPLYDWSGVPNIFLEYARERGSATHLACELYDKGTLDYNSVDDAIVPYLKAYIDFKHATGFEPTFIETPYAHESLGFAGMPDRVGIATKLDGCPKIVLEIKATSKMHKATGVQLAGYRLLMRNVGVEATLRYGVQLKPDGTYKLYHFSDQLDDQQFFAMLTNYQWRKKNG